MKTEHPAIAAKCTKRQIEVFEQIAIGMTNHPWKIIDALAAKGLVRFEENKSRDALGSYSWQKPYVPIDIHAQWCDWCDEHIPDDETYVLRENKS